MKTTLDLADDLLIAAKTAAVRRRTTLKAIVEHALRRELAPVEGRLSGNDDFMEFDANGLPGLKRRGVVVTSETIYRMMDEEGI